MSQKEVEAELEAAVQQEADKAELLGLREQVPGLKEENRELTNRLTAKEREHEEIIVGARLLGYIVIDLPGFRVVLGHRTDQRQLDAGNRFFAFFDGCNESIKLFASFFS